MSLVTLTQCRCRAHGGAIGRRRKKSVAATICTVRNVNLIGQLPQGRAGPSWARYKTGLEEAHTDLHSPFPPRVLVPNIHRRGTRCVRGRGTHAASLQGKQSFSLPQTSPPGAAFPPAGASLKPRRRRPATATASLQATGTRLASPVCARAPPAAPVVSL